MKKTFSLFLAFSVFWTPFSLSLGAPSARAEEAAAGTEAPKKKARSSPLESEKLAEGEKIGAGDVLDLFVYPQAELNGKLPVLEDGTVAVPTVGRVKVSGMGQKDAAAVLKKELSKYFVNAKVSLGVIKFNRRFIFVTGLVSHAGPIDFREGISLNEIIAEAGGFQKDADRKAVRVYRGEPGRRTVTVVNMLQLGEGKGVKEFEMQTGDLVEVPLRRDAVFVWGDVGLPGTYDYIPDMKLYDLLVRAAGLGHFARMSDLRIYHVDGSMEVADFRAVLDGDPSKNVLLRPGDIVFVPHRGLAQASEWMSLLTPWLAVVTTIITLVILFRQK